VDKNILEFWDTSGLDGLYTLRLQVVDHSAAVREAILINPFDPRPHQALIGLHAEAGREAEREREERALRLIYNWLGW